MTSIIRLMLAGLFAVGVPLGWYDGVDGTFTEPQKSSMNKATQMLSLSIDSSVHEYPEYPLKLKVTFFNNTDEIIYFSEASSMARTFDFEVKDQLGKVVEPNGFFKSLKDDNDASMNIPPFPVKSGEFSLHIINLMKLYGLEPNKTYTIQLQKVVGFDSTYKDRRTVFTNVLRFTVPK